MRLALDDLQAADPKLLPPTTKADAKAAAMVRTDRGQKPRTTSILWRGDVRNRGPQVQPNVPAILRAAQPAIDEGAANRLALADWLASEENPLTWRVMANRVWQHHFGTGLVETPSNFGRLGAPPTHPQLLDWLAAELRDNGGRLKSLHRLIVTSAAYRQSSQAAARRAERRRRESFAVAHE